MNERISKNDVCSALDRRLAGLKADPQLAQRIMMTESRTMLTVRKPAISLALVIALLCIMGTGALAAVLKVWGIIDFAGRAGNTYVPPQYKDSIVYENLVIENPYVTCTIQESYYDGKILRITANIVPDEKVLLINGDVSPHDPVETRFPNAERTDMSIAEYALTHYDGTLADISLHAGKNDTHSFIHNSDGSTTIYMECIFDDDLPQRDIELRLVYMPIRVSAEASPVYDSSAREITTASMTVKTVNVKKYTCDEVLSFPSVGVNVTNVTLFVTPLEIRYTLDFEITDIVTYAAQEDMLWFAFTTPAKADNANVIHRVSDGLSHTESIGRLDDLHTLPAGIGTVYRQSGSLGLDSFGEQYTICAYNAGDKRYHEEITFNVSER